VEGYDVGFEEREEERKGKEQGVKRFEGELRLLGS
jgi:hypothetical protein